MEADDTQLRRAMRVCDIPQVERLLAKLGAGADTERLKVGVNHADGNGLTFVHHILECGDLNFCERQLTLLAHVIDWRHVVEGDYGYVAWMIRRHDYRVREIAPLLALLHRLDSLAFVKGFGKHDHILAFLLDRRYAEKSKPVGLEQVKVVLDLQSDLLERKSEGSTALHFAVYHEDEELVKLLLFAKADVNAFTDAYYNTPLAFAASNGNVGIVRLLLDAGADPNLRNYLGQTPLVHLLKNRHPSFPTDLMLTMLARISDVNVQDYQGRTLMHYVAVFYQPEALYAALHNKHPDISIRDKLGRTPRDVFVANVKYNDPEHAHTRLLAFMRGMSHTQARFNRRPERKLDMAVRQKDLKMGTLVGYNCRRMDGIMMLDTLLSRFPDFTIPLECDHAEKHDSSLPEAAANDFKLIDTAAAFHSAVIFWSATSSTVSTRLEHALEQALDTHAFVGVLVYIVWSNDCGHTNMVLVDKKCKRWILFEPHGFIAPDAEGGQCHSWLRGVFSPMSCLKGFSFVMPNDMYDSVGFQALEWTTTSHQGDPEGFCSAWSIWFVHFYIRNARRAKSVKDLVNRGMAQLLRDPKRTVRDYIREYASYLSLQRVKLLKSLGFRNDQTFSRWPVPATDDAVALHLTQKWCVQ